MNSTEKLNFKVFFFFLKKVYAGLVNNAQNPLKTLKKVFSVIQTCTQFSRVGGCTQFSRVGGCQLTITEMAQCCKQSSRWDSAFFLHLF